MIRITITDDHPLIISGLKNMLRDNDEIAVIACHQNGKDLLKGLKKEVPDVLLLDIQMPDQQGDELAGIITKNYPSVNIIALTNLDSPYYINSMFQHDGVRGYVLKTSAEETLVKAIKTVAMGQQYIEPLIKERRAKTATVRQEEVNNMVLTRREKEVLQLIACDYSSHDIANELYLSKRTVDNHRTSLLLKLGVKNSASMVKKALDLGLIK